MMRYNLRPITVKDAVGFCDVFNTVSIESGFLVNGPLDKGYVPEVVEKSISHWIEESDVYSNYVLDIEGDIVGVISVSPESMYLHKIKHIANLCVVLKKSERGYGYGEIMVRHAIREAKRLGYRKLVLEVMSTNIVAVNLYKKCGFEIYGINKEGIKISDDLYDDIILMDIFLNKD